MPRTALHLPSGRCQGGSLLIEVLVAILIFAIAFLGMLAMQANAIKFSADANYRAEATFLSNQLIGLLSVADPATLNHYQHLPGGDDCLWTGADSTSPLVQGWLNEVTASLPGAAGIGQQIKINSANQVVDITLCWEVPGSGLHRHQVTTQLQAL